jgi:hypothetical protein
VRIHKRAGIVIDGGPRMTQVLKGMERTLIANHGPASLAATRKKPLFVSHISQMFIAAAGKYILGRIVNWAEPFWIAIAAAMLLCSFGGMRKSCAMPTKGRPFTLGCLSRASALWHAAGTDYACATPHMLPPAGYGVALTPPLSKADQFGRNFGSDKIILPCWASDDPTDQAATLRQLYHACPVRQEDAASTTMLTYGRGASDFITGEIFDKVLQALLAFVFTPDMAKGYSAHSFRVGTATALHAKGVSDSVIKQVCRWKSDASLILYQRCDARHRTNVAAMLKAGAGVIAPAIGAPYPSSEDDDDGAALAACPQAIAPSRLATPMLYSTSAPSAAAEPRLEAISAEEQWGTEAPSIQLQHVLATMPTRTRASGKRRPSSSRPRSEH